MRIAVLVLLVGCYVRPPPDDPPPFPPDDGFMDPADPIGDCPIDCGTDVCARDHNCYPANAVRVVHARWTIDGAPASIDTCVSHPDLHIAFYDTSGNNRIGWAPVPCHAGLFTVDKLPDLYSEVGLGVHGEDPTASTLIDESGDAMLDLP